MTEKQHPHVFCEMGTTGHFSQGILDQLKFQGGLQRKPWMNGDKGARDSSENFVLQTRP